MALVRPRLERLVRLAPATAVADATLMATVACVQAAMAADEPVELGHAMEQLYLDLVERLLRSLASSAPVAVPTGAGGALEGRAWRAGRRSRPADPYTRRARLIG
jgi:hypothetical protein